MLESLVGLETIRAVRQRHNLSSNEYIKLIISTCREDLGFMKGYIAGVQRDPNTMQHTIKTRISNMQNVDAFVGILLEIIDHQADLLSEIHQAADEEE